MNPLLRRMKLWHKFAVLGSIGLTLASVPLYKVIALQNANIAVAEAEDAGLEPLKKAYALQVALQQHEMAISDAQGSRDAVDRHLEATADELQTLDYALAQPTAKAWQADWDTLKAPAAPGGSDLAMASRLREQLSEHTFTLMDQIADASGLSLDPVAESYYLMTALVDHLPRLTDEVHRLRQLGGDALAARRMSDTQRAELAQASHRIHYLQSRVLAQVEKALAVAPTLKDTLAEPLKVAIDKADELHELAEDMAAKGSATVTPAAFRAMGDEATSKQVALHALATQALEGLLHDRVAAEQQALWAFLGFTGALLPLGQAVAAADAVAQGNLGQAIDDRGSDEAAQLLRSLGAMQRNLQQRLREDQERLAATEAASAAAARVAQEIGVAVGAAVAGDFSQRIPTHDKEAFHAQLCGEFNELIDTVSGTIREVRVAADQLGAASEQVSQTSQSLSALGQPAGRQRRADHRLAAGDGRQRQGQRRERHRHRRHGHPGRRPGQARAGRRSPRPSRR
jgi:methyl-accepting chemotaxis protein